MLLIFIPFQNQHVGMTIESGAVAEDDGVVEGRLEVGEELEEGVFRVERVVERRKRKVRCSCTEFALLYFDYFRGEWSVWCFGTGISGRRLHGSGRMR